MSHPIFTLVSTIFNEIGRLSSTIADLKAQTIQPNEIVITDAGSTDGTYEALLQWAEESSIKIVVLQEEGCNVARGRNLAIQAASNKLIASTDFGCSFHPEWLQSIITPFENPDIKVVGGSFACVEEDIKTLAAKANYILSDSYLAVLDQHFIPTSRSIAYYKDVWQSVDGYCEWLTLAADDMVFGKLLIAQGYKFHLVDKPYVFWGRHETYKAYGKESYRYGLGDGESDTNQKSTLSTLIETSLRYALFLMLMTIPPLIIFQHLPPAFALMPCLALPALRSYIRAFKYWQKYKSEKYDFSVLIAAFYLVEVTRISYLKGYMKGFFFSPKHVKEQACALNTRLKRHS